MDQNNRIPDKPEPEPEAETPTGGGLQDWLAGADDPAAAALPDWLSAGLPSILDAAPDPVPAPAAGTTAATPSLEPGDLEPPPPAADGGCAAPAPVVVAEPVPAPALPAGKPDLTLQITGPSGSPLQRPIELRIEVANRGSALATEVQLAYRVDEGIEVVDGGEFGQHGAGQSWLRWTLDTVKPGQGRQFFFRVRATVTGNFINHVTIASAEGVHVIAEAPVAVDFDASASSNRALDHLVAEIDREARGTATAARPVQAAARDRALEQHIVFQLAGTDFAVPISRVREIGRGMVVQPLPNVPDWLLGVANIRGDVTSMVDLLTFLGMERAAPGEHTMFVQGADGGLSTGLVVDRVRGIRPLAADRVAPAPTQLADRVAGFLRGVTEYDGRLLVLLDLDRLLLSPEMRQFDAI